MEGSYPGYTLLAVDLTKSFHVPLSLVEVLEIVDPMVVCGLSTESVVFIACCVLHLLLVARGGTLLMELELLHHYFGNVSRQGDKYYFCVEGST